MALHFWGTLFNCEVFVSGRWPELFAHDDGDFVFKGARGVEVLVDAPDLQAVAQVELDGGVVGALRLQHDGATATFARPVKGATEQERADTIAAILATDDEVFDTGEGAGLVQVEQDATGHFAIGQRDITAFAGAQTAPDIFQRVLVLAKIAVDGEIDRRDHQFKGQRRAIYR